jgi:hypothetical protein
MTDFQIRSDNVNVEQIMGQIRSRIREKRGVDYTEDEIRELANVKLEKFLDPRGVRSDLLEQFRRARADVPARNYKFEDTTIYESSRAIVRFFRKLLQPILKLFFNPNPMIEALHIQAELNTTALRHQDLQQELIHNLVLEITRMGIEVKNLKMRLESMSSRLDFDERRARALEGVVQYRPGTASPLQPPTSLGIRTSSGSGGERDSSAGQEGRTRRRRRRGRRPGEFRPGDNRSEQPRSNGSDGQVQAQATVPVENRPAAPAATQPGGGGNGEAAAPKPFSDRVGEG